MLQPVTVSLCLITKNEAHCILSCLDSARSLVDETIVVDTGSSDGTPRLAAEYGARVFHYTWTDNFAEARNYGLEQATSDWILVLDADEVLDEPPREEFKRLINQPTIEGYFMNIVSYLDGGNHTKDQVVRLFRNKVAYRFKGAIHEEVASAILAKNRGKGLAQAGITIKHFGYLSREVQQKNKPQRNFAIINRELKKKPDQPFLLYSLAVEHYQNNNIPAGVAVLKKLLPLLRGNEGYFTDVMINLSWGLLQMNQYQEVAAFVTQALTMLPDLNELYLIRGLAHLKSGNSTAARPDLIKASHDCHLAEMLKGVLL